MKYDPSTTTEINAYAPWELAVKADCSHDNPEAETFLQSIRDAVMEVVDTLDADEWEKSMVENYDGTISEIADGAPDVYTHTRWLEFVGTRAWQEDPTELGFGGKDMERGAGICLYIIAERLANALATEVFQGLLENEEVSA